MSSNVFPTEDEALSLTLGPDSVAWSRASDVRGFLLAGYALLLQVSHPTVGAGVKEHSEYQKDPWGRLWRTVDFVNLSVYGGPKAIAVGRGVREMHKRIKGKKPDGTPYHALEPEAYAWVHATLFDAIVTVHENFGDRMTGDEIERFYVEWLGIGRLLGVRENDLPKRVSDFRPYFDEVVENTLERTAAADDVLATMRKPVRPPVIPRSAQPVWRLIGGGTAHVTELCTIGSLPPKLRERLGLTWSRGKERELRAIARLSRSLTPVMPKAARINGPVYLRQRGGAPYRHEWSPPRAEEGARSRPLESAA